MHCVYQIGIVQTGAAVGGLGGAWRSNLRQGGAGAAGTDKVRETGGWEALKTNI